MKKTICGVLLALLAACGGNAGPSNAASLTSFNYAQSGAPTSSQIAAASGLSAAGGVTAGAGIVGFADTQGITGALLGSNGILALRGASAAQAAFAAPRAAQAITLGSGGTIINEATCLQTSETNSSASASFKDCQIQLDGIESSGTLTLNGSFSASGSQSSASMNYDLTLRGHVADLVTTDAGDLDLHEFGSLSISGSSSELRLSGKLLGDFGYTGTLNGAAESIDVSEAVLLDLTEQPTCTTLLNSSVEARRVWTKRPSAATATALGIDTANKGAKIVWGACGAVPQFWLASN